MPGNTTGTGYKLRPGGGSKGRGSRGASSRDLRPKEANPHGVAHNRGQERISRKIGKLVREEGKTPKQAAGQAFGMARQGSLGAAAKRAAGRKKK